jgi:type II secretory pathway component PulJ
MGAWIAEKFASPLVKWALIALALIGLVAGALWYVDSERRQARKDGAAAVESQVKTNTIVIERKIQRAEDRAPRTRRGVSDELRAGTF